MVIREVESMTVLQHPNIVKLLGITTMDTPGQLHSTVQSGRMGSLAHARKDSGGSSVKATVGIVLELCHFGTLQVRSFACP